MQNYLVVSTLVENSSDIICAFSEISKSSGCNIVDSRFSIVGQEVSVMLFVSGTWNAIAKMESLLDNAAKKYAATILSRRTRVEAPRGESMPYAVDVVGVDQPGIIFEIADFMSSNNLSIQDLSSNTYAASQTGARMFASHMTVNIPLQTSIAVVRTDFVDFCDRLNLDAIMEPVK